MAVALVVPGVSRGAEAFPRPPELDASVAFWKDVFSRYDSDQIIYFDAYDLSRVYEIHRLPPADGRPSRTRLRDKLRAAHKDRLHQLLTSLGRPGVAYDSLSGPARRLVAIWDGADDPAVYRAAAENLRSQRGIRRDFAAGVARSARYRDAFRTIFQEEDVPEDLLYLPHVESSYRWQARSGAGAVGMWQFMRSAARKYSLKITRGVDERLDPYRSARAAARYLKDSREKLGSWPLAVTSYNQGLGAMADARETLGTTAIHRIIRDYRGPGFGFAGRNFYPEFLATRELAEEMLHDPESPAPLEPEAFDVYTLPAYVKLKTLARTFSVEPAALVALNRALSQGAVRNREWLPPGFELKLPAGRGIGAAALFASIPPAKRPTTEPVRSYRVKRGDSLGGIAARFHTTVRVLQKVNGIRNPNRLRAGRTLRLP